jgi:hypothetical protein
MSTATPAAGDRSAVTATASTQTGSLGEAHFPVALVFGHGLFAATTLVLVLLTALGIGGS